MNARTGDWHVRFAAWQAYASQVRAAADRTDKMIQDRGWALAASVGIPRDGCCLHNAAIDDGMTGWCFRRPDRLKAAKRANYLVQQFPASRLAERIIARAWDRMMAGA